MQVHSTKIWAKRQTKPTSHTCFVSNVTDSRFLFRLDIDDREYCFSGDMNDAKKLMRHLQTWMEKNS